MDSCLDSSLDSHVICVVLRYSLVWSPSHLKNVFEHGEGWLFLSLDLSTSSSVHDMILRIQFENAVADKESLTGSHGIVRDGNCPLVTNQTVEVIKG